MLSSHGGHARGVHGSMVVSSLGTAPGTSEMLLDEVKTKADTSSKLSEETKADTSSTLSVLSASAALSDEWVNDFHKLSSIDKEGCLCAIFAKFIGRTVANVGKRSWKNTELKIAI